MVTTDEVLRERGSKYGNYLDQAAIAERIRAILLDGIYNKNVAADQVDAIHMIAVKLSRIANGDPNHADNWRDIAGYATLVADRLEGKERP